MPEISIIVPVFNMEKYLRRCIESILAQKYLDYELIIVDDESTDGSREICDEFAKKDKRIRVIHKKNGGVSRARNTGLEVAEGRYIVFCDSDDSWKEGLLERVFEEITNSKSDCVIFNYERIVENKIEGTPDFKVGEYEFLSEEKRFNYYVNDFFAYKHGFEVWDRMFKREIIEKNKLRFCTSCNNFAEDMAFVAKYNLYAKKIVCIPDVLYNYFVRSDSMMGKSKAVVKLNELNEASYDFGKEYLKYYKNTIWEKRFHVLYFLMMYNQYAKIIHTENYPFIKKEIDKIKRKDWFKRNSNRIVRDFSTLKKFLGVENAQKIILFTIYCRHGNWRRFSYESYIYYKLIWKPRESD